MDYPDVKVEIVIDCGLTGNVAKRFDTGARLGEYVAKDMIAVPIGPDMRMVAVAALSCFATRQPPQIPQDLTAHSCIDIRLSTHGGLRAWEFEKEGRELKVRIFNTIAWRLKAVLAGLGLAHLPEDQVLPHLADGRLVLGGRRLEPTLPRPSPLLPQPAAQTVRRAHAVQPVMALQNE